ncbi:MAG: tetratricopeptide repeat protein [Rhizomicrobium sp.]
MRAAASTSFAFAFAGTALAASTDLSGPNGYDRCLELVKRDPAGASRDAAAWANRGGGAAALHCQALAYSAMKRFPEAARALESAAADTGAGNTPLRAALLDQAGNAWLLAGDPPRAETALTSSLALSPRNEDVLFDRARARGAAKDWTGAIDDLTAVLALDPDRADVYVLRASARHAQGKTDAAHADIAHALAIYPDYPEALVERGTMRFEAGDRTGARADWQEVLREAPDGDAGTAARLRLAHLSASASRKK